MVRFLTLVKEYDRCMYFFLNLEINRRIYDEIINELFNTKIFDVQNKYVLSALC